MYNMDGKYQMINPSASVLICHSSLTLEESYWNVSEFIF